MSFFQSLIRRFSRRQENAPPDSFQNEPLEDDAKLDSDTNWENNTNPDDSTNLKTGTSSEDDANPDEGTILEDDTNLKGDQISKNHPNTEADAKPEGDASPNTTNVSSRDDKRTPRKSEAEKRYLDSLFCDAASEDEMNKGDINTIATNADDRPFFPLLVDEKNSPLPLAANTTPPAPSTPQYLTPAPPSSIFLRRVMNDSESPTITKGKYSTTPRNGTSTTTNESLTPSPDEKIFDQAQIADQPRLPWTWSTSGTKTKQPYEPTAVGKWWYAWAQDNRDSPRIISNIGRIMETELGVQRFGKEKCTRCQIEGLECWIYSLKATYQVNNPGSACARCRAEPRHVGCSLAQRRSNKRKGSPPPPPPPRLLLPKGGHQEYSTLYANAGASMKE